MGAGQGLRLFQGSLPALHGIDDVALDFFEVRWGESPFQEIHLGIRHQGAVHPRHELDALGGGVRPLVELPRQGLHRQDGVGALRQGEALLINEVHLGFGEDDGLGPLEDLLRKVFHVVAVHQPQPGERGDAQNGPELR